MKGDLLIFFVFFLFSISIKAEGYIQPSSELVSYVSYRQIRGDKLIVTDSVTLQINSREGDSKALIYLPYSKGDKVSVDYAWIEDTSGNVIRKLKNNEIKDRSYISDASLYEDDFVKWFELNHNEYPYRIVFSSKTIYSKYLQIADIDYSHNNQPVKSGKLVVDIPVDKQIKYQQKNITAPNKEVSGNNIIYTWNFSYQHRPYQINAPNTDMMSPSITVVPLDFSYGIPGSMSNWESFGNWVFRLNKGKDKLPPSEIHKIEQLLAGINDNKEKVKILYYYMQDYNRYINVKIDVGGLQAYPAEYVCNNRYGDCKALTNYMKTILKYAGITSYYTLVNMDKKVTDIQTDFTYQAFNHVILTVPFAHDTLFLECTSKNLPFGYIHTGIQNRKALLVDENHSRLIKVPELKPMDVLCSQKYEINLRQTGDAYVNIVIREKGSGFENTNYLYTVDRQKDLDKFLKDRIGMFDVEKSALADYVRDNAKTTILAQGVIYNIYKNYGNNIVITPFPRKMPPYEAPASRTQDIRLEYPEYYRDTIIYHIPGKQVTKIPEDIYIQERYGIYSLNFKIENNDFIIYKTIMINAGKYDLNEYNNFYAFIRKIINNENKKFYLEVL